MQNNYYKTYRAYQAKYDGSSVGSVEQIDYTTIDCVLERLLQYGSLGTNSESPCALHYTGLGVDSIASAVGLSENQAGAVKVRPWVDPIQPEKLGSVEGFMIVTANSPGIASGNSDSVGSVTFHDSLQISPGSSDISYKVALWTGDLTKDRAEECHRWFSFTLKNASNNTVSMASNTLNAAVTITYSKLPNGHPNKITEISVSILDDAVEKVSKVLYNGSTFLTGSDQGWDIVENTTEEGQVDHPLVVNNNMLLLPYKYAHASTPDPLSAETTAALFNSIPYASVMEYLSSLIHNVDRIQFNSLASLTSAVGLLEQADVSLGGRITAEAGTRASEDARILQEAKEYTDAHSSSDASDMDSLYVRG